MWNGIDEPVVSNLRAQRHSARSQRAVHHARHAESLWGALTTCSETQVISRVPGWSAGHSSSQVTSGVGTREVISRVVTGHFWSWHRSVLGLSQVISRVVSGHFWSWHRSVLESVASGHFRGDFERIV